MKHHDQQWVLLGEKAHKMLLAQGYTPVLEQTRDRLRWVLMREPDVVRWQEPNADACAVPSPDFNPNRSNKRMNEDGSYNPNRDVP